MSKWLAGAAVPLLTLAFWAGVRAGERGWPFLPILGRSQATKLATFEGQILTSDDLKAAIEDQAGALRKRSSTAEGRQELVKSMIRFELLAREARRKGYGSDPEILREAKRSMVARFLERELEEPLSRQPVEEKELASFFEAHRSDYQRPERVHLSDRFFEAAQGTPERARAQAAAQAAAEAEARPGEALAGAVDLGLQTRAQLEVRAGATVAAAAFDPSLAPGSAVAVETPQGFHALRLLSRESALELRFEDAREPIRRRILFERKDRAYQALVEDLETRAHVEIDQALVNSLVVQATTSGPPQAEAPSPRPALSAGSPQ